MLINFYPSLQKNLALSHIVANIPLASLLFPNTSLQSSDSTVFISISGTSKSISEQSNIAIISTTAFLHTLKLPDSNNFKPYLYSLDIQINSAKLAEAPDLSNVPSKYHKFANVFSKTKAKVLAPHHSYNL